MKLIVNFGLEMGANFDCKFVHKMGSFHKKQPKRHKLWIKTSFEIDLWAGIIFKKNHIAWNVLNIFNTGDVNQIAA